MSKIFPKRKINSTFLKLIVSIFVLGILFKFIFIKGTSKKLLATCEEQQCEQKFVVVLHGLVRSSSSMNKISQALNQSGYTVCNIQYPSRKYSIGKLAQNVVAPEIKKCIGNSEQPLNFVTHSMGGIIVRQLAESTDIKIKRVVMLSPPNKGSELVDKLKIIPGFNLINGQAGLSLGTESNSVPNTLGAVSFSTGVIIGNKSFNPLYSYLIPGEDDGKISVTSSKVSGMKDFLVVPHSHSFIMNSDTVIQYTINFLATGKFNSDQQTDS